MQGGLRIIKVHTLISEMFQVRTVSVSAAVAPGPIKKPRKFSEGSGTLPTSPSKIKNMAALFEQKH